MVFHLTDRTPYEVTPQGATIRLTTDFGILEGDAAAFAALAQAANRAARHGGTREASSRPLYIPKDIKEAAEKKAGNEHRTLADVMRAGFAQYVAGGIEPLKPIRAPRPAGNRSNPNRAPACGQATTNGHRSRPAAHRTPSG